ncbi:hypothetical protein JXJ21_01640 [candidate division KSB1 bacterium]|nr:hypothetical protein [candidate division KSB1 bacterium]
MKKIVILLSLGFMMQVPASEGNVINEKFPQEIATIFEMKDALPDSFILNIALSENGLPVAETEHGAVAYNGKSWHKIQPGTIPPVMNRLMIAPPVDQDQIIAVTTHGDQQAIGARDGLFLLEKETRQWRRLTPANETYSWALRDVDVVQFDSKGRLWFGCRQGIGYLENERWHLFTGAEGLPYNQFTCSTAGANGEVWFGTTKGAIRADNNCFSYRFSRRWLPNDYVTAIAVQPYGTAWIATRGGISRIERKMMTLEEKAAYFITQTEQRHNRMGFIADCRLKTRYDVNSWSPKISDNDGMYTAKYGAAQAFRYAATGEQQAKVLARRSLNACKRLVDITHETGFPARVIIPIDWGEPVNEQYGREYNLRRRASDPFWKLILPRFVKSKDGKYLWKCDTSSDELAGHYFFYGIYYDLVAETEQEKEPVRQVVRDITDHLIRNGFLLRDHDGTPTRWGNFSPEFLNSERGWEQRGLNSMMMLSFLNVAQHVTGDSKYAEAAEMLREKHQYHINAMQSKMYFPPDFVVPWDNNLCLMSLHGLIKYEFDPELLLMYRLSLEHAWLHISRQKNALWNIIYGALVQHFADIFDSGVFDSGNVFPEAGPYARFTAKQLKNTDPRMNDVLETLRGMPLDLIGYEMDNSHRLDIVLDPTPGQLPKVGWHVNGGALPIQERGHVRQDRDGFALYANEDGGYAEHEGTFFLLPYYMGRVHNLIK